MFLVKLFKDRCSHLELPQSIVGSDVCELFFSKVWGMVQNEKTYDGRDLVESVGTLARIIEFEVDPKGPSLKPIKTMPKWWLLRSMRDTWRHNFIEAEERRNNVILLTFFEVQHRMWLMNMVQVQKALMLSL